HFPLGQVVRAGAPAAELSPGDLDELEARYRAQQVAGLSSDPLAVREVAGVVVGDARAHPMGRRGTRPPAEQVAHVASLCGDLARGPRVGRIALEPATVLAQHRAAAGGIGDDEIGLVTKEDVDVSARSALGLGTLAKMREQ